MLTVHRNLHPNSETGRKGERGSISCQDYNEAEENCLRWYVRNGVVSLLKYREKPGVIKTENCTMQKKIYI